MVVKKAHEKGSRMSVGRIKSVAALGHRSLSRPSRRQIRGTRNAIKTKLTT
jgi:hypothetical protein